MEGFWNKSCLAVRTRNVLAATVNGAVGGPTHDERVPRIVIQLHLIPWILLTHLEDLQQNMINNPTIKVVKSRGPSGGSMWKTIFVTQWRLHS